MGDNIMVRLILILSLISSTTFAQEAVYLDKDQKSPFSGYLISQDKVKQLRNDSLERDMYKTEVDSYERSMNLYKTELDYKNQQLALVTNQNDKLVKTIADTKAMNGWEKTLYFVGGVLAAGAAVYLAHEIYK